MVTATMSSMALLRRHSWRLARLRSARRRPTSCWGCTTQFSARCFLPEPDGRDCFWPGGRKQPLYSWSPCWASWRSARYPCLLKCSTGMPIWSCRCSAWCSRCCPTGTESCGGIYDQTFHGDSLLQWRGRPAGDGQTPGGKIPSAAGGRKDCAGQPGGICERWFPRWYLADHLPASRAGQPLLRHRSQPQPRSPECAAGGTDDAPGRGRCRRFDGCRPAGWHKRHRRDAGTVWKRLWYCLRCPFPPCGRHVF